jgi:hypothetical protein
MKERWIYDCGCEWSIDCGVECPEHPPSEKNSYVEDLKALLTATTNTNELLQREVNQTRTIAASTIQSVKALGIDVRSLHNDLLDMYKGIEEANKPKGVADV